MIFYKENTGALDAQNYNCDHFKLGGKTAKIDGSVVIELLFYRHEIDAVENKTPYRTFTIVIPQSIAKDFPTISSAVAWLFAQPTLTSTSGKVFTIQGAKPV